MAEVLALDIPDVKIIIPRKFGDDRGYFVETYNQKVLADAGINDVFVQDNQSLSAEIGTVRGLHFQKNPTAQAKLVRVLRGSIFDVAVDLRKGSPTYGKWVGETLSANNGKQFYVPAGFAHGFCTLEANTEVAYKVTSFYSQPDDGGVFWRDAEIGIEWPVDPDKAILSEKDKVLPMMNELPTLFEYDV